ncbi:lipopolysaccharide biosynthesis protein [Streptomyces sp. NPDC001922]|uniref:lipopolysaccharide biosynthesis protein n=1 Tax=Streptomyces sp. NPDC001922 TaxID=3364624 RepID=UPI0036A76388
MTETVLTKPSEPRTARRLSSPSFLPRPLPIWAPVLLLALLGGLLGGVYGLVKAPRFTASSYVVVAPGKAADPATALGFAHAYGRVVTGGAVLDNAQTAAGVPAETLRKRVRALTSPEAPMIEIQGSDSRAEQAAVNANEVARALTSYANASAANTGVRLAVLSKALTPAAPTSPSARIAAGVGACAGGLLGCLVMLVQPGTRRRAADRPAAEGAR